MPDLAGFDSSQPSVVKHLMGVILKFCFPSTKAQKDYTYQPTVSVLMPCYNEGKTVYETIESTKSNYPNDKFEVSESISQGITD